MVNGRFQAWWPMEGEGKTFFHFFPLSPQQFYSNLQFFILFIYYFSFDLKVLLYHGPRPLFAHLFPFPWSINYDYASQCNKSSTPSLSIWFWLKLWFFSSPWSYGVVHGHILWASSRISKWRIASKVISSFDPNATSSWWRTWNSRSVHSSWSWTFSGLVLSYFSKFLHLGDLVTSRPHIWWQT